MVAPRDNADAAALVVITRYDEESTHGTRSSQRLPPTHAMEFLNDTNSSFVLMVGDQADASIWAATVAPHLERFEMAFVFCDEASIIGMQVAFKELMQAVQDTNVISVVMHFPGRGDLLRQIEHYCVDHVIPAIPIACNAIDVPARLFHRAGIYSRPELGDPNSPIGQHLGILVTLFYFQVKLQRCEQLLESGFYDMAVINSTMVLEHAIRELARKLGSPEDVVLGKSIWTTVDHLCKLEREKHLGLDINRAELEKHNTLGIKVRHRMKEPAEEEAVSAFEFAKSFITTNLGANLARAGYLPQ